MLFGVSRDLGLFHVRHIVSQAPVGFAERFDDLVLRDAGEITLGGRLPPVGHIEFERIGKFIRMVLAGRCAEAAATIALAVVKSICSQMAALNDRWRVSKVGKHSIVVPRIAVTFMCRGSALKA